MKFLIPYLIFCCLVGGCGQQEGSSGQRNTDSDTPSDSLIALQFPIIIETGTKIVYQRAQMTPRGLKYFLDTVAYSGEGAAPYGTTGLSPISLSPYERDAAPGLIVITLPGRWQETVFGMLDNIGRLRLNYHGEEIYLLPTRDIIFKPDHWVTSFRKGSFEANVAVAMEETTIGNQPAGKGHIRLSYDNALIEEADMFLVYNNRNYRIIDLIGK